MRPFTRGAAAVLAVPALTLSALVATSTPASAAPDPGPAGAAAAWMESQLVDGVIHYDDGTYEFDSISMSADYGFALEAVGGHDATVAEIVAAVEPRAEAEWYTSTYDGVTTLYAGSVAKTAAFAQATGEDPTDFGGENLISLLEGTVSDAPLTAGRVQDDNNAFGDANTFGQAYAVQALAAAGSPSTAAVTTFLVQQQCADGWFRLDFAERDESDQTCDGDAASVPDPDATAIALAALASTHDDALVPVIEKAEAWLLSQQRANGSWGGGPTTEGPNANSTGIIGNVLARLGNLPQARRAASWLRAHQLANVGSCTPYQAADLGAVAYNDSARTALRAGIDPAVNENETRSATAAALPVLALAPSHGKTRVLSAPGYVQAGGRTELGVIGAAPGEALCVEVMPTGATTFGWANAQGEAHLGFRLPKQPTNPQVQVSNAAGLVDEVELNSLGATKLPVSVKNKRIAGGQTQVITVKGLAPGEMASLSIEWPSKGGGGSGEATGGQANRKGVFKVEFKVPRKPGTVQVTAQGQFKNRKGAASFTITR